jgi:hypothetical protein
MKLEESGYSRDALQKYADLGNESASCLLTLLIFKYFLLK